MQFIFKFYKFVFNFIIIFTLPYGLFMVQKLTKNTVYNSYFLNFKLINKILKLCLNIRIFKKKIYVLKPFRF